MAPYEERLSDILFKVEVRHREPEEMQNAEKQLGGLLIKRPRMRERRQPSEGGGKKKVGMRRWNKRISKIVRGRGNKGSLKQVQTQSPGKEDREREEVGIVSKTQLYPHISQVSLWWLMSG